MTDEFSRHANSISADIQQQESDARPRLPADCYVLLADTARSDTVPPNTARPDTARPDTARPDARLFVLNDGAGNATHAELHFYNPLLTPSEQDRIKRVAQGILRKRYFGAAGETPLQIFAAYPPVETVQVTHTGAQVQIAAPPPVAEVAAPGEPGIDVRWVIAGVAILFVSAAIIFWLLNGLLRRSEPAVTAPATAGAAAAVGPAASAPTAAPSVAAPAQQIQTNNLPASKNANPAIGIGKTVRIREGYQSFVRSQPGGDQGEEVGLLQNGGTAIVLGGPVWLQGDSDTIVWWYVQLPDGTQGWTAANTSQFTLLDPV